MNTIQSLIESGISNEPTASLWLAVASVLLAGVSFVRSQRMGGRAWGRCLIEALGQAMAFAALVGMFYFLLGSNYFSFRQIYGSFDVGGSISNRHWQEWRNLYGGTCIQQDLQVRQYVTTEIQQTIEPTDPSIPVLYRDVQVEQPVTQNSINSFNGLVTMITADPANRTEPFNGYTLTALYEYEISNPTETDTRTEFTLPLPQETKLFQDVSIKMDGQEIPIRRIDTQAIIWERHLSPGQKSTVSIHYRTHCMDTFLFEVPESREMTNFRLKIEVNTDKFETNTEPANDGIQVVSKGQTITWSIDRAIAAPRLGIVSHQEWPYAPYFTLTATLSYAARALVLFLCLAMLTLLICEAPVHLRQMALLASLFALPFLVLMAGDFIRPASVNPRLFSDRQLWALPVISILALALAFVTLRRLSRLPLVLVLLLMGAFINGYLHIGLLPDEQKRNAMEGMIQAGMIAYVILLTLSVRIRNAMHFK